MGEFPLAYHITFGTYGTRLHGDPRGTVDRRRNRPGDPIVGPNEAWRRMEAGRESHPPIVLSAAQRVYAERAVLSICRRGRWTCEQVACRADHVHVLLSTGRDGKVVRRWLKRWLGEAMSARWPVPVGQSWWAKGGSVKWVWDAGYLERVAQYVRSQRTTA